MGLNRDKENNDNAASVEKPKKLKDGEPAVIHTSLSTKDAAEKVQEYLKAQHFTRVELTSDGVRTDWNSEHKCEGFTAARCWERADASIANKNGDTVIEILVSEKRRNAGVSSPGYDKGPQADPTMKLGAELRPLLASVK